MTPYTLREHFDTDGRAVAGLHDDVDGWSISVTRAPDHDPRNPAAARDALAAQLCANIAQDHMTQIVFNPRRVPEPLASLLRARLALEIATADKSKAIWSEALSAMKETT